MPQEEAPPATAKPGSAAAAVQLPVIAPQLAKPTFTAKDAPLGGPLLRRPASLPRSCWCRSRWRHTGPCHGTTRCSGEALSAQRAELLIPLW